MKLKIIGMLAAALGFSAPSYADYDVQVPVSQCSWVTTASGITGAAGVGSVYWYNASLNCPIGSGVATKSWWTSSSGQSGCSISPVSPYKLSGDCNSFSLYYTVIDTTIPAGAACTWTTYLTGGNGMGNVRVEFYSPIGPCKDKQKVIEYRNNIYYSTYYTR